MNELKTIANELPDLVGLRLLEVHRLFYEEPEGGYQLIDGHVYLFFDNHVAYSFIAFAEKFSLHYNRVSVNSRPKECTDISKKIFWQHRLGRRVTKVELIYSKYTPDPYGLRFILDNGERFALEYVDDNGDVFDALCITAGR